MVAFVIFKTPAQTDNPEATDNNSPVSNDKSEFVSVPVTEKGTGVAFIELRKAIEKSHLAPLLQTDIYEHSDAARFALFFKEHTSARDYLIMTGLWNPNIDLKGPIIEKGSTLEVNKRAVYFNRPSVGKILIYKFALDEKAIYEEGVRSGNSAYNNVFNTFRSESLEVKISDTTIKSGEKYGYEVTFGDDVKNKKAKINILLIQNQNYYNPGIKCPFAVFSGTFSDKYTSQGEVNLCLSSSGDAIIPGEYQVIIVASTLENLGRAYYNFGQTIIVN